MSVLLWDTTEHATAFQPSDWLYSSRHGMKYSVCAYVSAKLSSVALPYISLILYLSQSCNGNNLPAIGPPIAATKA